MANIVEASSPADLPVVRDLLREYQKAVGVNLLFEDFEGELAGLPGPYARPGGRLLLVRDGNEVAGCGALRQLSPGVGEMMRMWIRPQLRGRGLGRELARALLAGAREAGYKAVRLNTLAIMPEARALYRSLGFAQVAPEGGRQLPGTLFMELKL